MRTRRVQPRSLSRALPLACILTSIAACSGGGGGGGDFDGMAGKISVFSPNNSIVENEPNDDPMQAQVIGALDVGQSFTIAGQTTDDTSDPFDAYQFTAPGTAIDVTVTMTFDAANDFDFFIYDVVSDTTLFTFDSTDIGTEVGSFQVAGAFQVVALSALGAGSYTMEVTAPTPAPTAAEHSGTRPTMLGALFPDSTLHYQGQLGANAVQTVLVSVPYDANVVARASSPQGARTAVVRDVTMSRRQPLQVAVQTGAAPADALVRALSLLEVEVRGDAAGDFRLELSATPAAHPMPRARIAPLVVERELGRKPVRTYFGRPGLSAMAGQVLVQPRADADLAHELALANAAEMARIPAGGAVKVGFELAPDLTDEDAQRITFATARAMNLRAAFEYAEPNLLRQPLGVPNDPYYNLQWHYEQIHLPAAWDLTTGDDNVVVAVIDTGELQHPDLASRLVAGYDLISDASNAGDGDEEDADPTDVGDGDGIKPSSFHGTHVAGTIGAESDNGVGVAGVTWMGKIQHVRVLGKQGGTDFDIANGIRWAAGLAVTGVVPNATPALVLNLSLGGPGFSQTSQNAVTAAVNAGAVVVAAAGNNNSPNLFYPASYDNVISVSAVDFNGQKAPYSNFNAKVDVAAPGGDVTADKNGDGYADGVLSTLKDEGSNQFNYVFYQGTSMASPHVAGVVALMRAANPGKTPAQIEADLIATVTDLGAAGKDNIYGHGLINAYQAVLAAQGGGGGGPVLSLSTQSVSFTKVVKAATVQVSNIGGGTLHVDPPVVSTASGGNWLSASRVVVANPTTTDTSAIQVAANVNGLAAGVYQGSVAVSSDGGGKTIVVLLDTTTAAVPNVDIFVLAVDVNTFDTIAQRVVNPSTGLVWEMADIPAGDYILVAGSDDDNDNFICGDNDLYCGLYPTLDAPTVLSKVDGAPLKGLNFPVSSGFQASGGPGGGGLGYKRLQ